MRRPLLNVHFGSSMPNPSKRWVFRGPDRARQGENLEIPRLGTALIRLLNFIGAIDSVESRHQLAAPLTYNRRSATRAASRTKWSGSPS